MDGSTGNSSNSITGKESGSLKGRRQALLESDSDGEEEPESESSSSILTSFRKKWEAELQKTVKHHDTPRQFPLAVPADPTAFSECQASATPTEIGTETVEDEAKRFFLMGVSSERCGDLYDAVRFYRRAVQLVPDIERRVNHNDPKDKTSGQASVNDSESDDDIAGAMEVNRAQDKEAEQGPLSDRFLLMIEANGGILFEKNRPDAKVHVSDMPVEILIYILRWVVSNELDLRTLDTLSSVSRGFYCLCRDESLWKMASERVWSKCETLGYGFSTYREMFLSRPHVRFDGCYISKITYVRPGEHSFQDQSYRPWHMVEYYRYIRFFADGKVLFLTTTDNPGATVASLRDRKARSISTLTGRYHLYGSNLISAVVVKSGSVTPTTTVESDARRRRTKHTPPAVVKQDTNFHMDFEIEDVRGRRNWALRWIYYALTITNSANDRNNAQLNNELTTTFELSPSMYPPLYFSRVRSYTIQTEGILN